MREEHAQAWKSIDTEVRRFVTDVDADARLVDAWLKGDRFIACYAITRDGRTRTMQFSAPLQPSEAHGLWRRLFG